MSKLHESSSEQILCEKAGFAPRKFTLQQLEAMGKDPGGDSYDGWKPTEAPKDPKELKEAKAAKAPKEPKAATAAKNATKSDDSNATTGKAEGTGEGDNLDPKRTGESGAAQSGEGNGSAD